MTSTRPCSRCTPAMTAGLSASMTAVRRPYKLVAELAGLLQGLLHNLLHCPSRDSLRRPETLGFSPDWWLWFVSTHSHQIPERNQRVETNPPRGGFLLGWICERWMGIGFRAAYRGGTPGMNHRVNRTCSNLPFPILRQGTRNTAGGLIDSACSTMRGHH